MVLESPAEWLEVTPERLAAKDPAPLKVKEVKVEGRRYNLHEVKATLQGQTFLLRSQLCGDAQPAIRAAGAALPPTIREAN